MDKELAELVAPLLADLEAAVGELSEYEKSLVARAYLRGARDENRRAMQALGKTE